MSRRGGGGAEVGSLDMGTGHDWEDGDKESETVVIKRNRSHEEDASLGSREERECGRKTREDWWRVMSEAMAISLLDTGPRSTEGP